MSNTFTIHTSISGDGRLGRSSITTPTEEELFGRTDIDGTLAEQHAADPHAPSAIVGADALAPGRESRESWPRWRALLPSVLTAVGHQNGTTGQEPASWLLSQAGTYLASQGRSVEALPLHQRALRIAEAAYGPDHPNVAVDLNDVGRALRDLGRAGEALPLHERALRISEAAYGPDHFLARQSREYVERLKAPSLRARNNLAIAYQHADCTAQAAD